MDNSIKRREKQQIETVYHVLREADFALQLATGVGSATQPDDARLLLHSHDTVLYKARLKGLTAARFPS
jgi:hypothetical protein